MSYSGMNLKGDNPTRNQWTALENTTREEKERMASRVLGELLVYHHYGEFTFDLCGDDHVVRDGEPGEMYNYCSQFWVWTLHVLHMEDTAKEDDLDHLVANLKFNTALFYTHSKRSHYFSACLHFIWKLSIFWVHMSHCMCWKVPSSILVEDQDATLKAFFRLNIQFVRAKISFEDLWPTSLSMLYCVWQVLQTWWILWSKPMMQHLEFLFRQTGIPVLQLKQIKSILLS